MVRFKENNEVIREEEYNTIIVGIQTGEDISIIWMSSKALPRLRVLLYAAG